MNYTTIQVDKKTVHMLQESKVHPRQTYNELIQELLKVFEKNKQQNQYDEFLHKVQQEKMKELWDNPDDEAWNDA
jgi:hypothetical protein